MLRQINATLLFIFLSIFHNLARADWPLSVGGQTLPSLAPILKKVMPAVVNISTKTQIQEAEHPLLRDPFFRHFFNVPNQPRRRETSSLGSGVIVDAQRGYVLTNNHVIDKADQISVTLSDGRQLNAKLVGADPESDIAVIQVEPNRLTELSVADSDKLQVGDFVIAVGNPFGLGQTVTSGIISALGRSGLGIEGYEDFIQTDASINPGNSGGALIDLNGQLIGINTAILAPNGGNVGIGFAIPANMATRIMNTLIEYGEVKRGLLGITVQDLDHELAQALHLPPTHTQGAVITKVQPQSPADQAGLKPGDVVLAINGRKIKGSTDVRNIVGLARIGEEVNIEISRKGENLVRDARIAAPKRVAIEGESVHPKFAGVILRNVDEEETGVLIEKIHTASYLYQSGVRPGDRITTANGQRVQTVEDLQRIVRGRRELLLNFQREDQSFFLQLR